MDVLKNFFNALLMMGSSGAISGANHATTSACLLARNFKTLKYQRFFKPWYESLEDAKESLGKIFEWYNDEHRHINLGLLTPEMVHSGKVDEVLAQHVRKP